jgi:outer membrane lipoprotein-sorting protein
MSRRPNLSTIFALVTAVLLTTSGIAGTALAAPSSSSVQEDPLTDEEVEHRIGEAVVDAFQDRIESLETVQYTHSVSYESTNSTYTTEVVADLTSSVARTEPLSRNTTTIINETHATTYNADANHLTVVERAGDTVLPELTPYANESKVDYEYLGTETVDGQDTFALALTPDIGADQMAYDASITLYIDMQTYFPVQSVTEWTADGESFQSTATFDDVVLNEPVDEETFELDVPDDATDQQDQPEFETTEYESYETLVENANLSVPDGELDSFSFESATVVDSENMYLMSLTYTDGEETVTVNVEEIPENGFDFSEADSFEAVSVGDTTGYLSTNDGFANLVVDGDQRYAITGQTDAETVIDIGVALL